jgi:hypothetical protein
MILIAYMQRTSVINNLEMLELDTIQSTEDNLKGIAVATFLYTILILLTTGQCRTSKGMDSDEQQHVYNHFAVNVTLAWHS